MVTSQRHKELDDVNILADIRVECNKDWQKVSSRMHLGTALSYVEMALESVVRGGPLVNDDIDNSILDAINSLRYAFDVRINNVNRAK